MHWKATGDQVRRDQRLLDADDDTIVNTSMRLPGLCEMRRRSRSGSDPDDITRVAGDRPVRPVHV